MLAELGERPLIRTIYKTVFDRIISDVVKKLVEMALFDDFYAFKTPLEKCTGSIMAVIEFLRMSIAYGSQ